MIIEFMSAIKPFKNSKERIQYYRDLVEKQHNVPFTLEDCRDALKDMIKNRLSVRFRRVFHYADTKTLWKHLQAVDELIEESKHKQS